MRQENRKEEQIILKPEEVSRLLERAMKGDASVMGDVRKVLDNHPSIWQVYGDLTLNTEKMLVGAIAGNDFLLTESLRRQLDAKKEELGFAASSAVERLQIERIAITWLQVSHLDMVAAQTITPDPVRQKALQLRQDAAHRRYEDALKTLASLRKLLPATAPSATRPRLRAGERDIA